MCHHVVISLSAYRGNVMRTSGQDTVNADTLRLRYFDLAREISRATTKSTLQRSCKAATQQLGYDYYLFGGYYPAIERIVMSSNFPDDWRERYDINGYIAIDPTVKHCWTESRSIIWQKISFSDGKTGELERMVMEEAFEYGLRSGISVPVHGSGAEGSMLSLASSEKNASYEHHHESGLQIVVHAMHEATKMIITRDGTETVPIMDNLSPREIECLSWTARGKTSWDISRILEVSENTVAFHMRNAIKKLEVTNRSQAVAKAIAHSKITPF